MLYIDFDEVEILEIQNPFNMATKKAAGKKAATKKAAVKNTAEKKTTTRKAKVKDVTSPGSEAYAGDGAVNIGANGMLSCVAE